MLKILKVERPDLNFSFEEESIFAPNTTEIEGNPIGEERFISFEIFPLNERYLNCRRVESPLLDT